MGTIQSINPATGETVATYTAHTPGQARDIVELTDEAQRAWSRLSFNERAVPMRRAAEVLRANAGQYAELMAREMGKVIREGRGEIEKCAWVCEHYAENAELYLAEEEIKTEARRSFVTFQPLGVILAVMPWNFPFWQVFRFAAPSLMAGNAGVLKHASNVFGCAIAIEEIFKEAGFPKNLFRSLLIDGSGVAAVIRHKRVRAVTLTGSDQAGRAVASGAGKALKKCVLELGGSDPYVVLADADLETAVESCVRSRLINGGQTCISAKRFIVDESIFERFETLFVERMKKVKMGDPLSEESEMGPQARHDLRNDLHRQVAESVTGGARLLLGGELPKGPGAYYPPTVLTDVAPSTPAYEEELFGPVAALIRAKDEEDAIRIANDSSFGLGGAVFTRDLEKGQRIAAERIEVGSCFVNDFVKSDPRLPFGGIKESGFGRELAGYGIKELVNIKTVVVA